MAASVGNAFAKEKYSSAAQQYFPSGAVEVFPIYVCTNCNLRFQSKQGWSEITRGAIKRPDPCPRCHSLLTRGLGTATREV
jgi:hypothetical protein